MLRAFPVLLLLIIFAVAPAAAHPLGNFTINHLTKLSVAKTSAGGEELRLRYIVDFAEIPAFAAMRELNVSGRLAPAEMAAWGRGEIAKDAGGLETRINDAPAAVVFDRIHAATRPGAGGLSTLYLVADGHAAPAPGSTVRSVRFADRTYVGRLGWRDIVMKPATEPTRELTAYPDALLASPRNISAIEATIPAAGAPAIRIVSADAAPTPSVSSARSNQLSELLARGTGSPALILLTLMAAIGLGALHALEPGHGKTLLAVSLVGARATVKQAAILAVALTLAHTIGVIALGIAINLFKGYFVPETIYPWITLLSGLVIAVIGARVLARQVTVWQPFRHAHGHAHAGAHQHAHPHEHHHAHQASEHGHGDEHAHARGAGHHHHDQALDHNHSHDDEAHARQHAIPGTAPLRFGATVWAAMSGGVAPCPAALVVLLAAIALNTVAYGIVVIVAFSFGLAITLTGLGIAVVRGASWLQRRPALDRFVRFGPIVSATVIAVIGAVMVGQGLVAQGVNVSPLLLSFIALLAIAGYAFSHSLARAQAWQRA